MFKSTSDLRNTLNQLYSDLQGNKVSNSSARARVQIAKTILDTLKIEIAAANLGKQFSAVHFDETENTLPAPEKIRRIS